MSQITINKSKAIGKVIPPASKSMLHRYILCAALANGDSNISNITISDDIAATISCVIEMGAVVERLEDRLLIRGIDTHSIKEPLHLQCNESGSTMRFVTGIMMGVGIESYLYGSKTLLQRPMDIYKIICKQDGIYYEKTDEYIHIDGRLLGGRYELDGDVSSQFITGLLFALPFQKIDSIVVINEPIESRSYINITLKVLKEFGIEAYWINDNMLKVLGNQRYAPIDATVQSDYSNAAFLDAFNLLGGDVYIDNLDFISYQGDSVYRSLFDRVKEEKTRIDISDCPDLAPILMVLGAVNQGVILTGTKRLKYKESNRGVAMQEELNKFGVKSIVEEDYIEVFGGMVNKPTMILDGHDDHRIVMALCVLLSSIGGSIDGIEAVNKSYPNFFDDITGLGIDLLT